MNIQFGFYDLHKRFSKAVRAGDALERLDAVIDWEMFRAELERIDHKERKSAAGRKPMDRVVMFKMLILQNLYGLSDEALEYQVSDRLTFMRFLVSRRTLFDDGVGTVFEVVPESGSRAVSRVNGNRNWGPTG